MKTKLIKPASHTQKRHSETLKTLELILDCTGISKDEWMLMMFEYGCVVAEHIFPEELVKETLQHPKYNYWSWWLSVFLKDCQGILDIHGPEISAIKYLEEVNNFMNQMTNNENKYPI